MAQCVATNAVWLLLFTALAPSVQLNQVRPLYEVWISEILQPGLRTECRNRPEPCPGRITVNTIENIYSEVLLGIDRPRTVCVHCMAQFPPHERKTSCWKLDEIQLLCPTLPLLRCVKVYFQAYTLNKSTNTRLISYFH